VSAGVLAGMRKLNRRGAGGWQSNCGGRGTNVPKRGAARSHLFVYVGAHRRRSGEAADCRMGPGARA